MGTTERIRSFIGARTADAVEPLDTTPVGRVAAALDGAVGRAAGRADPTCRISRRAEWIRAQPGVVRPICHSDEMTEVSVQLLGVIHPLRAEELAPTTLAHTGRPLRNLRANLTVSGDHHNDRVQVELAAAGATSALQGDGCQWRVGKYTSTALDGMSTRLYDVELHEVEPLRATAVELPGVVLNPESYLVS